MKKNGFIPKGQAKRGRPAQPKQPQNISTKEFGATQFLQHIASDITAALQVHFPAHWQSLFALAINRLIYQSPLKNCQFLFEESFLSQQFNDAKLDKNNLTQLLQIVGSEREKISKFLSQFIAGSEHIVFDASHITTQSEKTKMAQKGYNHVRDYDPQVNLFYMFSVDKQAPTYYRLFPGNIHGMSALQHCLSESQISNCIAIGDKGFQSEKNLGLLQEAGLKYILPLKRNSVLVDYGRLRSRFYQEAFDGHFIYEDRPIFYTTIKEEEDKKVVIFTDKTLGLEEERTYLKRIAMGYQGYDMEGYKDKQISFGTLALITNGLEQSPQKLYEHYKTRMEVEGVFDTYKNLLAADRSYMQSDRSMEAWVFINHLAMMLYYRIFNLLKNSDLLQTTSPYDLLMRLARINKIRLNNQWVLAEINSKTAKLILKLNIPVT